MLWAEPPVQVERDETLWVAPTGNVVRAFGGKTPFQLLNARLPRRARRALRPAVRALDSVARLREARRYRTGLLRAGYPSTAAELEGSAPGNAGRVGGVMAGDATVGGAIVGAVVPWTGTAS